MIVFEKPEIKKNNVIKTLGSVSGKSIKNIVYNGTTYPIAKKKSKSGNIFYSLDNCVQAKLSKIVIAGDGEQKRYSGFNMLDYTGIGNYYGNWYGGQGYLYEVQDDGKIVSLSTADGRGCVYSNCCIYITLPAGTYTLCGYNVQSKVAYNIIRVLDENNSEIVTLFQGVNANQGETRRREFTLTETKNLGVFIKLLRTEDGQDSCTYLQLICGTALKPFEPYVGGVASPSVVSPQPYNGCNGDIITLRGQSTKTVVIPSSVEIDGHPLSIPLMRIGDVCDELEVDFSANKVVYKKRIDVLTYSGQNISDYVSTTGSLSNGATVYFPISNGHTINIDISNTDFGREILQLATDYGNNIIYIGGNVLPTQFTVDYFEE